MDTLGKQKWNLLDGNFAHHISCNLPDFSVAGQESKFLEWDRDCKNKENLFFYSHDQMLNINTPKDISFGWIFESRGIIPETYQKIENTIDRFHYVFTHNSDLLNKYDNCRWIPGGGIWIGGNYGMGTIGINKKTQLCSIVSSNKLMCQLHAIRKYIYDNIDNRVTKFGQPWVPINQTLESFMFSIVVENFVDDLYFTEKLLNCFAVGTIPIYLGAQKIDKLFNIDGILQFSSPEELNNILNSISPEMYNNRMSAITENFNKCQKFRLIEDYIYQTYYPFPS